MLLGHRYIPSCCIVDAVPSIVKPDGTGRDEARRPLLHEPVVRSCEF